MLFRFFRRRTVWCPTWLGWTTFLIVLGGFGALWWFQGEAFLALNRPAPADVLVVEGWIGGTGVHAAGSEFKFGGYRYIVATGSLTGDSWDKRRWSYAIEAEQQLLREGIARDRIILAVPVETKRQRTHAMAVAARQALQAQGIEPKSVNVFTHGPHARRSRLVFARVFGSQVDVGVISWAPPGYESAPWWYSSERADDFLKETVGYVYELLFWSGR
jgi:uncharacterized SAM-binding protein YcdF (DUF218 family)